MKIRFQCIGLALAAALGTAAARDGSGGYLATVGPAALRFQRLPSPVPILPPLEADDKPSGSLASEPLTLNEGAAKSQQSLSGTENTEAKSGDPSQVAANLSDQQRLMSNSPIGLDAGRDFAITTQMFLRFFAQSTNSSQPSIVAVPLSFLPAQPSARLSSSGEYSTSK